MKQADIGLIGLAVMGQNLILNMNDHGITVACFNRTVDVVDEFIKGPAKGTKVIGCKSLKELVASLKTPRRIMMMIKAGDPVDQVINELVPFLEKGDIIIDGGNSHFPDTERRCQMLKKKGIYFMGMGVSGGEDGARFGPSLMPGGHMEAWPHVKNIFQTISAKAEGGEPCCDWVGSGGSGHFVKMVHNGIEYGDIQLISEAYDLMYRGMGMNEEEIAGVFRKWNRTELESYLIEITASVLSFKDQDDRPLVQKILDVAGQKGTGKWSVESSLEEGIPITLIGEAVFARSLSGLKEQRQLLAKNFKRHPLLFTKDKNEMLDAIQKGLYAAKISSYAQGYMLMRAASDHWKWNLNYGAIALMWRNGCIIRSRFLGKIKEAFDKNAKLSNLLLEDFFRNEMMRSLAGWRKSVMLGIEHSVPMPCTASALAWFDSMTSDCLYSASLTQGIRDYFGAHTYERKDQPRGKFFHTDWTGHGGKASAGSYNA